MTYKLYYHKTDGGAEYLMDTFLRWEHNGKKGKEGVLNDKTKYIVRIDGDKGKDCELTINKDKKIKKHYLACIWCGGDIPKNKPYAQYCSVKCRKKALGQN